MGETKRRLRVQFTQTFVDGLRIGEDNKPYSVADAEVRGLQVRVLPSGSKVYSVRALLKDGTRVNVSIGNTSSITLDKARKLAKTEIGRILGGENPNETKRAQRVEAITLRELIEHPEKHRIACALPKATTDRLKKCFEDFLDRRINDRTIPNAIKSWRKKRIDAGILEATVNRDVTALSGLFTRALDAGLITEHPLRGLKKLNEATSEKKIRYLDGDEEKRLRDALDAREKRIRKERESHIKWHEDRKSEAPASLRDAAFADYLKPMVVLSLNTGLRRGELFDIEWRDVDFNARILTVRAQITKARKARIIPLNSEALGVLKGWKAQTDGQGRVFKSKDEKRFTNCDSAFEAILEEAKVTRFRWHDMRHHFASKLVMGGVDLPTVKSVLGHSKYEMTLRYAHLSPTHTARAVEVAAYRPADNVIPFEPPVEEVAG